MKMAPISFSPVIVLKESNFQIIFVARAHRTIAIIVGWPNDMQEKQNFELTATDMKSKETSASAEVMAIPSRIPRTKLNWRAYIDQRAIARFIEASRFLEPEVNTPRQAIGASSIGSRIEVMRISPLATAWYNRCSFLLMSASQNVDSA